MILIVPDHNNYSLDSSTINLLEAASRLGLKEEIHILIIGYNLERVIKEATNISNYITKILVVDAFYFGDFLAENHALQISKLASDYSCVIFSNSSFAKSIAPRLAGILDIAPISEVTDIISKDIFERFIYTGKFIETVSCNENTKILTINTSFFANKNSYKKNSTVLVEHVSPIDNLGLSILVDDKINLTNRPDLLKANIVVAGGRALGSKENFDNLICGLADKLGAAVGASRAAVDAGYTSNDLQIGQTGKSISPKLYFAIGISGAAQHIAGICNAGVIVSINNDRDAPIFQFSDYGIVGNLFDIVPKLIKLL
ncbi:electron transfer flavoprotein subunit alpha/FixB family protein [Candidatus Kinetoplastidibacterium crithidiae]|uniref:Electron transfer flavoprotein subunit alpha n=1 Tax=Candidatus Kinetoplastidibacterium crithidiae TCC036E TaxID=1208918 RepID=M1M6J5_9PROT|nr:electron transfer flavoprotein subunit alpha/FixB family protein [Candidatus Kinetoplastibacterium crithidii]AFZ82634.1 electron transfer flavoprotein alpha subunit [Candidatus Kinetoplastibacterium crithidii (ex Angomonas deanei ATCC 30255)]AGF47705.1 electron transfer flavoprotein alpha subunit [Candidatus Kinetoplastibacterium crithidii TCC036E]EPY32175.1 electron transfer flavoprotein alpha subunit [Angomonas deanei]|eukprot:EPY32175.1 electron transfer flavoprotein alpha subunit [Angomonas deanei]